MPCNAVRTVSQAWEDLGGAPRRRTEATGRSRPRRSGDPRPDEVLIASVDHDPEAFGELYRRHVAGVAGFIAARVREPEATAELAAETFAIALEQSDRFDPERGVVRAWLFGIAANLVRRHWRQQRNGRAARDRLGIIARADEHDLDALGQVIDRLDAEGLLDLLDELPERQQQAVRLRMVDGADHDEIAAAMDVTRGNARVLVHRGIRRLAELRDAEGPGDLRR